MRRLLLLLVLVLLHTGAAWAAEIIVIVNSGNPVASMSREEIENIYLGRKASWPGGAIVAAFAQKDPAISRTFLEKYVKKSPDQYLLFWRKAIFTGKGTPPLEFDGNEQIKRLVASKPESIGYISADALDATVKRLQVR